MGRFFLAVLIGNIFDALDLCVITLTCLCNKESQLSVTLNLLSQHLLVQSNNGNTRTASDICSKLTMKTPERHQHPFWCLFILNLEQISHIVLVFPWLTLNKLMLAG